MNRRTLILLAGAGFVGLLYFGDQAYRTYIEAPAAEREKQLTKINKGINQANDLIAEKLSLQRQLDSYEKMSLPFDTELTRTGYQDWLLNLVKSVGFVGTSVDAAQPRTISIKRQKPKKGQSSRKAVLVRYSYSLRCRGSLQQLVSFLFEFYRSGHLHKIRSMTLNPTGGGSVIDTALSIEALAMLRTEREVELSSAKVSRVKNNDGIHYADIARRNIFSRTGSQVLQNTHVTGITFGTAGKPQVWLRSTSGEASQVFHNDEVVELEAHRIEVLDIQSQRVLFLIDGQPVTVGIGQPLAAKPKRQEVAGNAQGVEVKSPDPANPLQSAPVKKEEPDKPNK